MAPQRVQSFDHHTRLLPAFHFVVLPILAINVCYAAYQAVAHVGAGTLISLAVAIALVMAAILGRIMALTVQDRVIRLEERMRMRALLPADLQGRIEGLTPKQLVALRFACDEELPALTRKVLDEQIEDQNAIKRMVTRWRADYLRA
jgi:HAMP domain-containing protein